ncbi:membrane fimbriae assembly protein [Jeongeupia sp. HS-3]|uniref:Flp pilus assembly protein CpaB n=1 Tax=Jeongeupia sp. HS-3 TaxID=1009682 RepID=UPI0018A35394|nr:Flp pilus assembly protein CpaB [Jeongeupia sp. HS-3]BCL77111.1 membrane fimbriae assembly protein [Jeongeupia sp. HS-3]
MSIRLKRTAYALGVTGLALLAFTLGARWAGASKAAPMAIAPQYPAVKASANLTPDQPVTLIQLQSTQQAAPVAGGLANAQAAVGRLPVRAIPAGSVLTEADFSTPNFAALVAPDERAMAMAIDEIKAVGNHLQPGDHVDVFFTVRKDGQEVMQSEAIRLLADVRVLALGGSAIGAKREGAAVPGAPAETNDKARSAVLAVPNERVADVVLAQQSGQLTLVLRSPAAQNHAIANRTVAELTGQAPRAATLAARSQPMPAAVQQIATAAPPPPRTPESGPARVANVSNESGVEVIRGKGQ